MLLFLFFSLNFQLFIKLRNLSKLKATGTIEAGTGLWRDPNTGATNKTGFTALPGGIRESGTFRGISSYTAWWSATENRTHDAWWRGVNTSSGVLGANSNKDLGYYVRCLRD